MLDKLFLSIFLLTLFPLIVLVSDCTCTSSVLLRHAQRRLLQYDVLSKYKLSTNEAERILLLSLLFDFFKCTCQ